MLVQRKGAATSAVPVAVLAELQHESIQRGKQRRKEKRAGLAKVQIDAAAALDKEELDKPVKARIKRDSTRGRLAGGLPGLFQIKLDGDPKAGKVIISELKPSDAGDERGKLRQGDVVLKISTTNGPTKGIGQFESIEGVRRHIKNLGPEMTLHVARRRTGGGAGSALAAGGGGATAASASHAGFVGGALQPYEQLQVGVVESVGRLLRGALLPRVWYDTIELQLLRLRLTPPRESALRTKLAQPLNSLPLLSAGRLWVRVELERTGTAHTSEAVPYNTSTQRSVGLVRELVRLPIHPLGDAMRLSVHYRGATSLLLGRVLGGASLHCGARAMGEAREVEATLRLIGPAGEEEAGRLTLSARYLTRSEIGRRHAATRVAALGRGFLERRKVERRLAFIVHVQCRWRARQAVRMMEQLKLEKFASSRIQAWWVRGQHASGQRNKRLLLSGVLQLDEYDASLLHLPIRVLHSSLWPQRPLATLAKTALPSALLPPALCDRHLVLHDAALEWCQLHHQQPVLIRAPRAAQRRGRRALRKAKHAIGLARASLPPIPRPPHRGRAAAAVTPAVDVTIEGDDAAGPAGAAFATAAASAAAAKKPAQPMHVPTLAVMRAPTAMSAITAVGAVSPTLADRTPLPYAPIMGLVGVKAGAEGSVPILLADIEAVSVVSYATNEWEMRARHVPPLPPSPAGAKASSSNADEASSSSSAAAAAPSQVTLRLQTRSAAALNAWMRVLQPVLHAEGRDDEHTAEMAQRLFERHIAQLRALMDAALDVARADRGAAQPAYSAAVNSAAASRQVFLRNRAPQTSHSVARLRRESGGPRGFGGRGADRRRHKSQQLQPAPQQQAAPRDTWLPRSISRVVGGGNRSGRLDTTRTPLSTARSPLSTARRGSDALREDSISRAE